jgi:hypothetical protein
MQLEQQLAVTERPAACARHLDLVIGVLARLVRVHPEIPDLDAGRVDRDIRRPPAAGSPNLFVVASTRASKRPCSSSGEPLEELHAASGNNSAGSARPGPGSRVMNIFPSAKEVHRVADE